MPIVDARTFFSSTRPLGVPEDAPSPDWETLVEWTRSLDPLRHPLPELRAILERENTRLGADNAALDRIRSIGPDTAFVVAGQQAGLFGGPLYTLYKALHAIRLAARLGEATGRNVVPVFWTASDDHDFEEVRTVGVRTADGIPYSAEYAPEGLISGAPVGEIILDEGISGEIDRLADRLPKGDWAGYYLDILRRCWRPGERWSDAFSAQMAVLLSVHGLVMLDPRWISVKALFLPVMRAELANPLASSALVNEEADRFATSRERRKALRKGTHATNLFLETGGARQPLIVENGGFRAGEEYHPVDSLAALLDAEPERFSPGAALRPVCQDALLPVAAIIAGPGERRYLGQIRPLYGLFGVSGSIPWPRASFTLVDSRTLRTAEKEHLPLERLFDDPTRILSELAGESLPPAVSAALETLARNLDSGFDAVSSALDGFDPTLSGTARKEKSRALHGIESLRDRISRAAKSRLEGTESRIAAAHKFLLPDGDPQERRFGPDAAITVLGPEGISKLLESTSPGEEYHRIVMPERA